MSTSLRRLLTTKELQILTDKYVLKLSHEQMSEKYGDYEQSLSTVKLLTIYEDRQKNHTIHRKKILFDEEQLIKRVWREYITDEVAKGKTSIQIAQETSTSLEKVNSYF